MADDRQSDIFLALAAEAKRTPERPSLNGQGNVPGWAHEPGRRFEDPEGLEERRNDLKDQRSKVSAMPSDAAAPQASADLLSAYRRFWDHSLDMLSDHLRIE